MSIIVRPDGDTDLQRATIHNETSYPQTITDLSGNVYQVGRIAWADPITVTEAAIIPGDVPWTNVVQHMAQQFTGNSLQGTVDADIPIAVVAADVPYGSANNWGGHKIVSDTGLTFDWTKWDTAVSTLAAEGLTPLTLVPHAWPKGSVFVSPAYVPSAADWKESLDAFVDQAVLRAGTGASDIEYFRAANETINPGTDSGTNETLWADAALNDTDWTGEGLAARMWWMYSAAKGARTYPNARVFLNDFYVGPIDGSGQAWGQSDQPAEMTPEDYMAQRGPIMVDQLHEAFAIAEMTGAGEVAGLGGLLEGFRLDGIGCQSHFKSVHGICENDMKWQLWEINGALGLGIYLTEINTKTTDSGNLDGIFAGSTEMDTFAAQVAAVRLYNILKYTKADNRMWTFWTDFTDEGDNQAITLYRYGARTVVYDVIRDVVNNPPAPIVKRAALTNFYASGRSVLSIHVLNGDSGVARDPGSPVTSNIKSGSQSDHDTVGIQLMHSRYKKRVAGVLSDFDPQNRTTIVQIVMNGNGANNTGFKPYIEHGATDNELLRFEFNSSRDLLVHINGDAGTVLGRVNSSDTVQVTFTYDGTTFEFAYAEWNNGTRVDPTTTDSVTATIADVVRYEFVRPTTDIGTNLTARIGLHAMIDGDDGPANTAELLALAPVTLGTVMSQAEITAFDPT